MCLLCFWWLPLQRCFLWVGSLYAIWNYRLASTISGRVQNWEAVSTTLGTSRTSLSVRFTPSVSYFAGRLMDIYRSLRIQARRYRHAHRWCTKPSSAAYAGEYRERFFFGSFASNAERIMIIAQCNAVACTRGCTKRLSFLPLWVLSLSRKQHDISYHCWDSGHGGQTKDLDGDEDDGYDEGPYLTIQDWPTTDVLNYCFPVIYPVDFEANGHIVDDLMHEIMVRSLPPGCRMTAIFDASVRRARVVELKANISTI